MTELNTATDPNLPEPKGISSASANKVYVSNGSGSGTWVVKGAYGGIYTVPSDAVTIGTIGTTAKKFNGFANNSHYLGVTVDHVSDSLVVNNTGRYFVNFSLAISTVAVGDAGLYKFVVRVNNVATQIGCRKHFTGTTDTDAIGASGILSLTANDSITLWLESDDAGADDINIWDASLNTILLGV